MLTSAFGASFLKDVPQFGLLRWRICVDVIVCKKGQGREKGGQGREERGRRREEEGEGERAAEARQEGHKSQISTV